MDSVGLSPVKHRVRSTITSGAVLAGFFWSTACASTSGPHQGASGGEATGGAGDAHAGNGGTGGRSEGGGVGGGARNLAQSGQPSAAGTTGAGGVSGASGTGATGGGALMAGSGGASGSVAAGSGGVPGGAGSSGAAGTLNASGQGGMTGAAGMSASGAGGGASGGAATCPASATATPGEKSESIMVGGTARSFVRHIPPGYSGKTPVPVVIDFHPLGGSGSSWKGSTGWGSLADQEGFIMIWPDGVGNSWNVGRCCSTAQSENIDDVAFTKAIVSTLQKEACIDPKRVYATGCSNGGGMAFKVACDAADVIAAVAPVDFDCVTGASANPSCASCAPARPISEIQFRGTSDAEVPYGGGSGPRGTQFPGAEENFSEWKGINMCTGAAAPLADQPACEAYGACGAGVQTILCTVQNGMHCGNYKSFDIVNLAWGMFQKETLP